MEKVSSQQLPCHEARITLLRKEFIKIIVGQNSGVGKLACGQSPVLLLFQNFIETTTIPIHLQLLLATFSLQGRFEQLPQRQCDLKYILFGPWVQEESSRKPQRRSRFNSKKKTNMHIMKKGAKLCGFWEERGVGITCYPGHSRGETYEKRHIY